MTEELTPTTPFTTTAFPNALLLPLFFFTSRAYGITRSLVGIALIIIYGTILHPQGHYWGIPVLVVPGGEDLIAYMK